MNLIKTSLLNGIAVVVRIMTGLVSNKILALYIGPTGYALIGQFQNTVSIIVSLAGGLASTGVTKITAEHINDEPKQHAVWQTAVRFSLIASLLAGVTLLTMGRELSEWLLHRSDMTSLYFWLALALPAMCMNNIMLAIVNGKKEISLYIIANIVGSLSAMILTGLLTYYFALYGALVAFMINPSVSLITTGLLVSRATWFHRSYIWGKINTQSFHDLLGISLMGLTSALVVPLSYILIRNHLTTTLGSTAAGYWQASWKISEIYLMLVTSTLSVYYLPRIAEIRTSRELRFEIVKVYRFIMPIVVLGAAIIYIYRDFIIRGLFTNEFLPMQELFPWQLAGDVIRIGSWVLGYILLGRAMVKVFIITEIVFSATFYLITCIMLKFYGIIGVSIAYAVNYSLFWVCMAFVVHGELKRMEIAHAR